MNTLRHDLIAQRAASVARIADMTKRIAQCAGTERLIWEGMLRSYIDAMPHLDAQIAACVR